MKTPGHNMSPGKQIAAAITLGSGVVLLVLMVVIKPLHDWRSDLLAEQEVLNRDLQSVQALARELERLRQAGPEQPGAAMSLSALVDQSLQGRSFQPSRIQLNEAGQMQLRLESVSFDDVLAWLHELEGYPGVLATAMSVTREQSGRVSVGLTLQQL